MYRVFTVVWLILISGGTLSAQIAEWSDWYEDPKVPGIALRQRCDPVARETQVEFKNSTRNVIWKFENARKLIKGYKGSEFELLPEDIVQFSRPTKDCSNPAQTWIQAKAIVFNVVSWAGYVGGYVGYKDNFAVKGDVATIHRAERSGGPVINWEVPCSADPRTDPLGRSTPPASNEICGLRQEDNPRREDKTSANRKAFTAFAKGYRARSECNRITGDGFGALVAKNICNTRLYVRACAYPSTYYGDCTDGTLSYGQSMIFDYVGLYAPVDKQYRWTRAYAWAAEGGEAAKRWVQSHRPENTKGCGDPLPPTALQNQQPPDEESIK